MGADTSYSHKPMKVNVAVRIKYASGRGVGAFDFLQNTRDAERLSRVL